MVINFISFILPGLSFLPLPCAPFPLQIRGRLTALSIVFKCQDQRSKEELKEVGQGNVMASLDHITTCLLPQNRNYKNRKTLKKDEPKKDTTKQPPKQAPKQPPMDLVARANSIRRRNASGREFHNTRKITNAASLFGGGK